MDGPCHVEITGSMPKEMMDNRMKHLREDHPEMISEIKAMSKTERDKWNIKFMQEWEDTPDVIDIDAH